MCQLISKILWRNADKTVLKMTTLQGLCVCLREYTQIRVGTRGMSESVLVLELYCRIVVITAACEQSSTCFCRDHTQTLTSGTKKEKSICFSLICLSVACNYLLHAEHFNLFNMFNLLFLLCKNIPIYN